MVQQQTLNRSASYSGIGLHSGNRVTMTFLPAPPNTGIRFDKGEVVGVEFSATVKDGRARGRVVPRYRDLGIGFTEKGGGLFARAKRSITRFIANRFVIRRDNPGDGGKGRLVSAPIDLEHRPSDGLFTFLWYSLRDPIRKVVKP